ncbi:MAG: patatin-like phospholipase family protein [Gammaproteobacteria bacterium]
MADQDSEKLGLALSGGGFRASFFHVGVLAQMAEQGLLRHVEVISTVSGGSIVGALYYLHVKKLLESKPDAEIRDQDYTEIVQKIEIDFLKATERNIRMATFASFKANYRMVFLNYSRSDRVAELYNEYLYRSILQGAGDPVELQKLKIYPPDGPADFHPKRHNGDRKAKVPILVLNATTLNTGRNWQFTASTMGEPPVDNEASGIDKKSIRLRRAKGGYTNMIPLQQDFPLAHAVAASACVPGLFEPMAVSGLYYDKIDQQAITPQLVDGGVFDNQGTEGLLQNGCTCFVISDAAGQMDVENQPATGALSVLLRASGILQDRVRSESLAHLIASQGAKGDNNIALLDLRKGIEIREIAWIDQNGEQQADRIIPTTAHTFDVDPKVQERLALIRTDLDAFTEVEAYSLMRNGYLIGEQALARFKSTVSHPAITSSPSLPKDKWKFNDIAAQMQNPSNDYLYQLKISRLTFGKPLLLLPALSSTVVLSIAVLLYLSWPQLAALLSNTIPVYVLFAALLIWLLNTIAPGLVKIFSFLNYLRPQAALAKRGFKVLLLMLATVFFKLYLITVNVMYLRRGKVADLKK